METRPNYYLSASFEDRDSFVAKLQPFRSEANIPIDFDVDGDALLMVEPNDVKRIREVAAKNGLRIFTHP